MDGLTYATTALLAKHEHDLRGSAAAWATHAQAYALAKQRAQARRATHHWPHHWRLSRRLAAVVGAALLALGRKLHAYGHDGHDGHAGRIELPAARSLV